MADWERGRASKGTDLTGAEGWGKSRESATTLVDSVTGIVEKLGFECVHVSIKTDSSRPRLQVLIDSLGGINVDDCETVSRALNRLLDSQDFTGLENNYYLEVSSPGLERPLFTPAHYERFQGQEARVQLVKPLEGRKTVTGKISNVSHDNQGGQSVTFYIDSEEREIVIPFGNIKSGRLVFRGFEPKAKNLGGTH